MNARIQALKIANYKKKILSQYNFLNIEHIFYGNEDISECNFIKKILNSNKVKIKKFNIYDATKNVFVDTTNEYIKVFGYFKTKLKMIFSNDEDIIFNILYNHEFFRIQCPFFQFISNINKIDNFEESIVVYNTKQNKIIAIFRMEYAFEVLIFKNQV